MVQVPVALVSADPEARVKRTLSDIGVDSAISAVVCSEDVTRGRPDPEGFLYAAQRIGRPPARCVVFGMCPLAPAGAMVGSGSHWGRPFCSCFVHFWIPKPVPWTWREP